MSIAIAGLLLAQAAGGTEPWPPPTGQPYPVASAAAGRHGSSILGFTLGENGQVTHCAVRRSSGTPELDESACAIVTKATVFKVDQPTGKPLDRVESEVAVHWLIAGAAITANDLPIGVQDLVVLHDPGLARRNLGRPVARDPVREPFEPPELPAVEMDPDRTGPTAAILAVDPRGRVERCSLVRSSGNATLDQATCQFARNRLRYRPGIDAWGRPVHGLDLFKLNWAPVAPATPAAQAEPPRP
jgi:TonB family protein